MMLSSITSMESQVGPASTLANSSPPSRSAGDRVLGVVEQLTAVRAVQAVVEVVPPATVALGLAHHACDTAIAAGAAMKRPGSAMTRTCAGSFASAARIGAQNSSIGMTASL